MKPTRATISLWAVIERLQRQLEREGLDQAVVDAAVVRRLADLLGDADAGRSG